MKRGYTSVALFLLAVLGLTACAKSEKSSDAVEAFWKATISRDRDKMLAAVCPEWEEQAALEFDAFEAVTAKLEGLDCQKSGSVEGDELVSCQGKIVVDYNGELRDMSLEDYVYRVRKDDGEWKVCGYE